MRRVRYERGATICRCGEADCRMFTVVRGRCRVTVPESNGHQRLLGYLGRGDHFGEMALLTNGTRTADVSAVLNTELFELDQDSFVHLLDTVPHFAANLSRTLGFRLHAANLGRHRRPAPAIVGVVHGTRRAGRLVDLLIAELRATGERVALISDRAPSAADIECQPLAVSNSGDEVELALRGKIARLVDHHDRVLIDLPAERSSVPLAEALGQCEEVLWLVDTDGVEQSQRQLDYVLADAPGLAGSMRVVWLLKPEEQVAPRVSRPWGLSHRDMKVEMSDDPARPSRRQWQGLQRLVRHLRGLRLGLALGGGGARGLAHLGVMRALDEAGLCFDMVAGTSSGAMMGVGYAAGYNTEEGINNFSGELTPPRIFNRIPAGRAWYLYAMFRMGRWDGKLRKFFYDWTFEQLPIPCTTMSADLYTGKPVGRERGDVVHAMLESINLPMIAAPIFRDNMALVDGGILNNLPADKLVEQGADLVVGVNVVARLKHVFAGMRPDDPTPLRRRPGYMETLLRVTEVQGHGINAIRTGSVDLLVEPDTSHFEFADFTKAVGLAEVGQEAMEKALPQIQQMVSDLEQSPE